MTRLMEYVDICVANEEDAGDVFSIYAEDTDVIGGKRALRIFQRARQRRSSVKNGGYYTRVIS